MNRRVSDFFEGIVHFFRRLLGLVVFVRVPFLVSHILEHLLIRVSQHFARSDFPFFLVRFAFFGPLGTLESGFFGQVDFGRIDHFRLFLNHEVRVTLLWPGVLRVHYYIGLLSRRRR